MTRRDAVLTAADVAAAPIGARLPDGRASDWVKQSGGAWLRIDGNGNSIGSAMSSATVASYGFKRYELRRPEGARR